MSAPDLSARVTQLEAQLAALSVERSHDRQTLERLRRALDFDGATRAHSRLYIEAQLAQAMHQARRDTYRGQAGSLTLGLKEVAATASERATISVSIGLAAFPTHAQTAKALLDAAGRALYRAKRTRNCVACAD